MGTYEENFRKLREMKANLDKLQMQQEAEEKKREIAKNLSASSYYTAIQNIGSGMYTSTTNYPITITASPPWNVTTGGWTTGIYPQIFSTGLAPEEPSEEVLQQIEDAKNSPHAALVGVRAWMADLFSRNRPLLQSLNGVHWPEREELRSNPFDFNDRENYGGIHAARSEEHLFRLGYGGQYITGEVYMWGRVVHGKIGLRSTFAYPKNFVFARKYFWAEMMAEAYGVDYSIKT